MSAIVGEEQTDAGHGAGTIVRSPSASPPVADWLTDLIRSLRLSDADWDALQSRNAAEDARIAQCLEDGEDPEYDTRRDEPWEARTRGEI